MRTQRWSLATLVALVLLVPSVGSADGCGGAIGVPVLGFDTSMSSILGSVVGQTFHAPERLIERLSVWVAPQSGNATVRVVFTTVETAQRPYTPVVQGVIHTSGPVATGVPTSSGPHEVRFLFDPPIRLPAVGYYAFFLQAGNCNGGWYVLTDRDNPYAAGMAWVTGRSESCSDMRSPSGWDAADLVFEASFCEDTTTPVHTSTWGQIKIRYR